MPTPGWPSSTSFRSTVSIAGAVHTCEYRRAGHKLHQENNSSVQCSSRARDWRLEKMCTRIVWVVALGKQDNKRARCARFRRCGGACKLICLALTDAVRLTRGTRGTRGRRTLGQGFAGDIPLPHNFLSAADTCSSPRAFVCALRGSQEVRLLLRACRAAGSLTVAARFLSAQVKKWRIHRSRPSQRRSSRPRQAQDLTMRRR